MTDTQSQPGTDALRREQIARIIDEPNWRAYDRSRRLDSDRPFTHLIQGSLAKAERILSLSAPVPDEGREELEQHMTKEQATKLLADRPPAAQSEAVAWRCFHCDEVFTDPKAAANHFGVDHVGDETLCQMAQVDGGIARVIADLAEELQRYRSEDNTSYREFYALGADHQRALIAEEQKGYDRGLADGRATPPASPARSEVLEKVRTLRKRDPATYNIHDELTEIIAALSSQGATREAVIEECAKFVEQHQETISETAHGTRRHLTPRRVGNQMGIAYVDGLRALCCSTGTPEARHG